MITRFQTKQTEFTQRDVIKVAGSISSGPFDYFDLYHQLGIATSPHTDVQAALGVMLFAECAKFGVPIAAAMKVAIEVIQEGVVHLASEAGSWHVNGSEDQAIEFRTMLNDGTPYNRKARAQDMLNIPARTLKQFLIHLSDGSVCTSNNLGDVFRGGVYSGGAVVNVLGLAERLRSFRQGALFTAVF